MSAKCQKQTSASLSATTNGNQIFDWWNLASLVEVAYWASCRICALENANSTKLSPRRIRPTGLGSLTASRFRQSLLRSQAKMQLNCGFRSRSGPTLRPGRILSAEPNYRTNDQAHKPRRSKRSMFAKCQTRKSSTCPTRSIPGQLIRLMRTVLGGCL